MKGMLPWRPSRVVAACGIRCCVRRGLRYWDVQPAPRIRRVVAGGVVAGVVAGVVGWSGRSTILAALGCLWRSWAFPGMLRSAVENAGFA